MAIDRLPPGLVAAFRSQLVEASRKATPARKDVAKRTDAEVSVETPHDTEVLRRQLVDAVRDVALDDPEAMAKARPRVVRAILLWEFGAELREYGEWQPMLDGIVQAIETHPRQRAAMDALVGDLKKTP